MSRGCCRPGAPPSARSGRARRARGRRAPRRRRWPRGRWDRGRRSSPTSLPTFAGLLTPTPTSSNAGMAETSGITSPADEAGAPDHDSPGHLAPSPRLSSPGSKTHSRASSSGMKGRSGPFSTRNPVITALEAQEAPVNETDERLTLPLLPLTTGVVLPQMVVTLALETDEAKAAADAGRRRRPAAARPPRRRPLRPRRHDRPHRVRRRPAQRHPRRSSCAACSARRWVPAWPAPAPGLWVEAEPVADGRADRARRASWPRAAGRVVGAIAEHLGGRRLHRGCCAASTTPARWPTPPAGGPTSPSSARSSCSRPSTSRSGWRRSLAWAKEALAELELDRADPQRGHRRHGEDPARVPAAPADGRDPQGAGRGRRRRRRRGVPRRSSRSAEPARGRPRRRRRARSTGSSAPASRTRSTAGSAPGSTRVLELPWGDALRRRPRRRRRPRACSTPTTPASTT